MTRLLFLAFGFMGISACGSAQTVDVEAEPKVPVFEMPADMSEATYFIRPDFLPPNTSDMSRGDVPRDDYGRPYTYEYLGKRLPNIEARFETGEVFSTRDLFGKWTIIRVWGLWCHDSRGELDEAAELARLMSERGDIDFMSIHVPQNAEMIDRALRGHKSLAGFFANAGYSYPSVVDKDASLRDQLRIRWTPSYLVIAPDLTVQGFRTSLADAGEGSVEAFVEDIALTQAIWSTEN